MLAYCAGAPHCSCAFSDVMLAPIHTRFFFECLLPFQNMSVNKSYIYGEPEGTRELPPIPEVKESWSVEVRYGKACSDLPLPSDSHYNTHWTLERELVMTPITTPGLVLIKPPTWKPSKITLLAFSLHMNSLSQLAAILTTHYSVHIVRFNPPLNVLVLISCASKQKQSTSGIDCREVRREQLQSPCCCQDCSGSC